MLHFFRSCFKSISSNSESFNILVTKFGEKCKISNIFLASLMQNKCNDINKNWKPTQTCSGVPDSLHSVLHLVQAALGREDGGPGIVSACHGDTKIRI